MIKLLKFAALTGWIVVVTLLTINSYSPDVSEQDDMVRGCYAKARERIVFTWDDVSRVHIRKSGMNQVLLVLDPDHMYPKVGEIHCLETRDGWVLTYP